MGSLHSVLNIPNDPEIPIRLIHPSFHDFLSDEARCKDRRFFVQKASTHGHLLSRCLKVMFAALKQNMCNLQTPGSSPQDIQRGTLFRNIPWHVQYACQYWVEHLACASAEQSNLGLRDGGIIQQFFQKYYLYWLEAMSLMGKVSEAVLMVAKVGEVLEVCHPNSRRIISCWLRLTFCIRVKRIRLCMLWSWTLTDSISTTEVS